MNSRHPGDRVFLLAALSIAAGCSAPERVVSSLDHRPGLASAVPWSGDPELAQLIAAIRDTTVAYHDVEVARARGYRPSSAGCEAEDIGAMGIHYGNGALLGILPGVRPPTGNNSVIDPLRPEVLLYEPEPDGRLRLVAIEYVVYRAAWDAVNDDPPTLLGVPFDQKFGADAHGHADHYELHLWLWRHNPLGMFAPWNPKVSCP